MRIFEVPCVACGAFSEILWRHIEWPEGRPAEAAYRCPHCQTLIPERQKGQMVDAGVWRVTNPDVQGHHGYRLNALVSTLPNTTWGKLASEFVVAKNDPEELRVFVNTILAEASSGEAPELDEDSLAARAEPFNLETIPPECMVVTAGIDVADDRLECSVIGWTREHVMLVLAHIVLWGSPDDDSLWAELDELLQTRSPHPLGGTIGVDGAAIDSGDGDWTEAVYRYCSPRARRRIMAIKGMCGRQARHQIFGGEDQRRRSALDYWRRCRQDDPFRPTTARSVDSGFAGFGAGLLRASSRPSAASSATSAGSRPVDGSASQDGRKRRLGIV